MQRVQLIVITFGPPIVICASDNLVHLEAKTETAEPWVFVGPLPRWKDRTMPEELSRNERIKEASRYLRGTLAEGLAEEITGAIVEDDQQLVKFHGMYLQDDRDLRAERRRKKMEAAFAFMVRLRIPGGVLTPSQYLALDEIARLYAGNTMRITTRQTVQLHGIIKSNLRATMARIDAALLTTIAACGDVNRNVICNSNPDQSRAHAAALATARTLSDHLLPRTPAYREIWLDGERIAGGEG
jgi:sulfite reductase (NADPH) hemoprotein beta-component